jgi:hypothetical protein
MPKVNLPQYGFSAGAIGSKMLGRADLQQLYGKAAKDILNMVPTPQGTLMRRPGTRFMRKAARQDESIRLIPFIYDNESTYMLELVPGEIRVFKGRQAVLTNAHAVVNGTFGTDLSSWELYTSGSEELWDSDFGAADLRPGAAISQQVTTDLIGHNMYAVVLDQLLRDSGELAPNAIALSVGTTAFGSDIQSKIYSTVRQDTLGTTLYFSTDEPSFYITLWSTTNNTIVDNIELYQNLIITTDFTNADIDALSYTTSGQKLYFAAPNRAPKVLLRTSDFDWYFQDLNYLDGPYFDLADPQYGGRGTEIELTPSATSGAITLTASDILFNPNDVGRHVRYRSVNTANWGWAIITNYISPTQVSATVKHSFDDTGASIEWTLGAWGETAGYPSVVSASTGRICWANSPSQPNGFWASRASAPNVYSPDEAFDDNITASTAIATLFAEATDITSMASGNNKMFVGSSSGIFSITGLSEGFYGIAVQRIDTARTAPLMPLATQGSAFFISAGLRNLYSVSYDYEQLSEGYRADDVTDINDDYALLGFIEGAVTHTPTPVLWFRMATGDLLSLTYKRSDKLQAWARHSLGGDQVFIESMATQPRSGSDDLWLVVTRTINDQRVKFVEYMTDFQTDADLKTETHYVDAGVNYSGEAITSLSALNHLVGSPVAACINGASYGPLSLNPDGTVTSAIEFTTSAAGIGYTSSVTMLHQEGGSQTGSVFGRPYRLSNAHIRFWNTNGAIASFEQPSLQNVDSMIHFNESAVYGEGDNLYSGWKTIRVNSGALTEVNLVLSSTGTLAFNPQAIMLEVEASEF